MVGLRSLIGALHERRRDVEEILERIVYNPDWFAATACLEEPGCGRCLWCKATKLVGDGKPSEELLSEKKKQSHE